MTSKLINPWGEDGARWDRITLAGVVFEGKVEVTGTPWKKKRDHRHARGRNGARTVGAGWDLGEWTITLSARTDEEVDALGRVIAAATDDSPATQDTHALEVDHPAISVAGVTQVTLTQAEAPEPTDAGGLLVWVAKVKAYKQPTPRVVTRTPAPAPQSTPQVYGQEAYQDISGTRQPRQPLAPTPPAAPTADP